MMNVRRCILLTLYICGCSVRAVNFDLNKVAYIQVNENDRKDPSYFGYSLLLQRGTKPIVIVGSPKQSQQTGGSIFSCDVLSNEGCTKYSTTIDNNGTFNGNFFGVAIDGEDEIGKQFVACAPRKVSKAGTSTNTNYYLRGSCFLHTNSSLTGIRGIELSPLKKENVIGFGYNEYYYDNAFGEAGIAISYKNSTTLIMGATGIKNWNGALVIQSLIYSQSHYFIPKKENPSVAEIYNYMGYNVGYAYVRNQPIMYAGAPRAEHLLGKVKFFHNSKETNSFTGEEMGAYFGSVVLAQDVNNDGSDDLFIGAPTAAGNSFDEGCVYFYKNALSTTAKLFGKGKKGSRFGSSIAALGDIDLDKFNDVAISAPFENDGRGVVYIFMGSSEGIRTTYSQRLVPSDFPGNHYPIKGFGIGLSRGNDVDGNGHNDLAVGAFKSGHVLFIPTKSVIDFRTILQSNESSVSSLSNQITIKYCVNYKSRSKLSKIKSINFQFKLDMDYRVEGPKLHVENVTVLPEVMLCKQRDVKLMQSDINPLIFSLETKILNDSIHAAGTFVLDKNIPYSHGCGTDDICQTQIMIEVKTNTNNIIVGLTKTITVKIYAENAGEPGYQCQIFITAPDNIQLMDGRRCKHENSTFICSFAATLFNSTEKEVIFDVSPIQLDIDTVNTTFKLTCLGDNMDNEETLILLVTTLNSPYIEGKSDPENYENYDISSTDDADIDILHTFTLGNFGPSPVKADVYLLVPQKKFANIDLFRFVEAKQILRGLELPCTLNSNVVNNEKNYEMTSVVRSSSNKTVYFDCYEKDVNCLELFCDGDYLYKSTETAKYTLKIKTNTKILAEFFKTQSADKNILAFVSSAFLYNGTRIEATATTLLLNAHTTYIPLWVYIVASVVGILLLGLIVFICYKCHFFDRNFKEKLNSERLMDQHIEMDDQNGTEDGKS
ncbi:integrin alpha-PS5-like [Diorhabda carinulata]|uniref:integrin alpha-PS5-like n=1 Tax=Diorhabda carinulata TaxID=1163345 RepID=UPI0025A15B96|nr:integrin alpha-PS5-like [Diorhabda carinulata]